MNEPNRVSPMEIAAKYVWWKDPGEALANQVHFLAMLMTYGTVADTRWMLETYSREDLLKVLREAPPGVFNGPSWRYWHLRLGIEPINEPPQRTLPE